MYRAKEKVTETGLYRCTTCGVMIPVDAGEVLPTCPTRCPDVIWTFFDQKWHSPPGEVREAAEAFPALDLRGDPRQIPAGARLTDVSLGPQQPGFAIRDPKLAAFHFDGRVYFGSASELFSKTRIVSP